MDHINSGRSWSPELRIFLVHCVKVRERLWRKFGSGGQDVDARQTLWQEIQYEISNEYDLYVEIEEIKKTWKNLKDNFLRVKKATNNEGTSKPGGKKWFFFDELKFLDLAELDFRQELLCIYGNCFRPFNALEPDMETEVLIEPPIKKKRVSRELDCMSIPIIDSRINTKQNVQKAAIILSLDSDLSEIARLTDGKWGTTHPKCCSPGQKNISYVDDQPSTASGQITEENSSLLPRDDAMPEEIETVNQDLIGKIVLAINKKRSDYQEGATNYFAKKKMPPNGLKKAMQDFDAFVYHNKRRTAKMNKIILSCVSSSEFEQVFKLLERYRDKLPKRNRIKSEINITESALQSLSEPSDNLKKLQAQKILVNSKIMEIQREIDRITNDLSGQLSVIRKTNLKTALEEAESNLEKLLPQRNEIEETIREQFREIGACDYSDFPHHRKLEQIISM